MIGHSNHFHDWFTNFHSIIYWPFYLFAERFCCFHSNKNSCSFLKQVWRDKVVMPFELLCYVLDFLVPCRRLWQIFKLNFQDSKLLVTIYSQYPERRWRSFSQDFSVELDFRAASQTHPKSSQEHPSCSAEVALSQRFISQQLCCDYARKIEGHLWATQNSLESIPSDQL